MIQKPFFKFWNAPWHSEGEVYRQFSYMNKISSRERQVLKLIANELTTKEIADQLYISCHTALSHRKNIMNKLDVKNTAGMIRRGFELGILTT